MRRSLHRRWFRVGPRICSLARSTALTLRWATARSTNGRLSPLLCLGRDTGRRLQSSDVSVCSHGYGSCLHRGPHGCRGTLLVSIIKRHLRNQCNLKPVNKGVGPIYVLDREDEGEVEERGCSHFYTPRGGLRRFHQKSTCPDVINKGLCGTNLVTLRPDSGCSETFGVDRVGSAGRGSTVSTRP